MNQNDRDYAAQVAKARSAANDDDFAGNGGEMIEPDYPTAADAWLSMQMTMEAMRHVGRCQDIAAEYAKRLELEKAGHPLNPYQETPK